MRVFWAWALCALLVAGLGGCAGSGQGGALSEGQAQRAIEAALSDVEDIYYRETKASELVDAGLGGIHGRYPAVDFSRQGEAIVATVAGNPVYDLAIQNDKGAATEWAEQVAPLLVQIATTLKGEDKPNLADLTDAFLEGIASSLDIFTGYRSPRESTAERQRSDRKPGTLGIRVKPEDSGLRIVQVYNASALGSGLLRRGDLIVEIDGASTTGIAESAFHDLVRGAVGSPIVLTILRSDDSALLPDPVLYDRVLAAAQ